MRVAVSEQGYSSAVEELVVANQTAAHVVLTLADRLRGTGGMAGDDHTATEFAESYDEAAAASLDALESLVGAFGSLARLAEASLANHAVAEADATLSAWARAVVGPRTAADGAVGVLIGAPPSSLGADTSGPGGMAGVVLDHLEDVFWPNADTDRLRAAGAAWHQAAGSFDVLVSDCDRAGTHLAHERSPEVPLALASLDQLRAHLSDLGAQLTGLGDACTDYADHVDTKRAELLQLLEDLALELGIMAGLGVIGSFLSGGAATGLAGGAATARLASAGSKAREILESLRILASTPALRVRSVSTTAGEVGTLFSRFSRARVMLLEGTPNAAGSASRASPWLLRQKQLGGHTIEKHVGKTLSELRQRFVDEPWLRFSSTFRTGDEAVSAINEALRVNQKEVAAWLASGGRKTVISADLGREIGHVLVRESGEVVRTSAVRLVLRTDSRTTEGWRLVSAFPCP